MWHNESYAKRQVHRTECLHKTAGDISYKQLHSIYLRIKIWKTSCQANILKKKAAPVLLMPNKKDFKPKLLKEIRKDAT